MGQTQPTELTNWGRSQPARTNAANQLARVALATPHDLTAYLYGWDTPGHTNNVLGRYVVTYGSGGVAQREQIEVPARGLVLHYVTAMLQIDTIENQSPPTGAVAKAHIGLGRPTAWRQYAQLTAAAGAAGTGITIPAWTTSIRLLGQFNESGAIPWPAVADGLVQIAQANNPTFAAPAEYNIAQLFDGFLPLRVDAGFVRLFGGATTVTCALQIDGIR
jgi:hypothetical protein